MSDTVEVDRELFAFIVEQAEKEYRSCVNSVFETDHPEFMDEFETKLDRADELLVEAYND